MSERYFDLTLNAQQKWGAAGPSGSPSASAALMDLQGCIARLSRQILNPVDLYQAVCEEALKIFGAESAVVLSCSAESRTGFSVKAQSGGGVPGPLPSNQTMLASAFRELEHGVSNVHMQEGTEPAVLIPLPQRGSPHALLVLRGRTPQFATDAGRLQIAKIFGDLVSIALENADMFERVSSSQREWENTFDSIADPIYIVDNEYRLKKMNKSLASYAMQSIKLPQGQFCYQHIYHRNTICPWCPVPKMMQTGQAVVVEAPVFADGLWQIQAFPFTDKSGIRVGSINVLRDMTLLKRMQEQLIESEKMASTGKLISGVAHEVRNPLFGISTTARALANELENKEEIKPFLDIITNETGRLNRLMEDLLNYARPVKIDKNASDIVQVVQEVIDHYKKTPQHQDVVFTLHCSELLPPIYLDRNKINQVLVNLFENGIQHAAGQPKIDVFLQYMSLSDPHEIHIVVKDNGTGISAESLQRIFDPFFTTRQRGTGLGLSIVRKVIHDHGGRISVESHQGIGTTFRISLPVVGAQ
ncbi:MAG TPA: ATP-binding protein [Acidobacteriota bacterium]|nr:ATP-binding protein [Acidobacteriota bacterium]